MKKSIWEESVVLITGGGSGIGREFAVTLAKRGAKVIITDIHPETAANVAVECGEKAISSQLDVSDGKAVSELINNTFKKFGRLDFLFNNAGIGLSGEAFEIPVADWDRVINTNLRGVVNGVLAAYPLMINQGFGHIINTASLAGLGPAPLLSPYSMTKHAIVGLSISLRIEAVKYGVKVSVLCPGPIDTPILDSKPITHTHWYPDTRRFLTNLVGPPYPVHLLVEKALRAIEQNKSIIVIPGRAKLAWIMGRLSPSLIAKLSHKAVGIERAARK